MGSCKLGRWPSLILLITSTTLISGFIPGASLFIELFVQAGVYSSVCETSTSSVGQGCTLQYDLVAGAFNAGMTMLFLGTLPIGVAFDRYGGRAIGVAGGVITCLGTFSLMLVVLGSTHGYDTLASKFLLPALCATDMGSLMNSYAALSFMFHFPDHQALIIALMNATYSIGAVNANAVQLFMRWSRSDLSGGMVLVLSAEIIATVGCSVTVPSHAEYLAKAKEALGMPLPKPKTTSICSTLRNSVRVLQEHWHTHVMAVLALGFSISAAMMYSSLAGEYAKVLFRDASMTGDLPAVITSATTIIGGIASPALCFVIGKLSDETQLMLFVFTWSQVLAASTVSAASWNAQVVSSCSSALVQAFAGIFFTKYASHYASPAAFATVAGVLMVSAMVPILGGVVLFYAMGGGADAGMVQGMTALSAIGAGSMGMFNLHLTRTGLPDMPVVLPEDEAEMAEPFGCKTLDEVVEVLHMESRQALLKELSRNDVNVLPELLSRIDFTLMEAKLGLSTVHTEVNETICGDESGRNDVRRQHSVDTSDALPADSHAAVSVSHEKDIFPQGDNAAVTEEVLQKPAVCREGWDLFGILNCCEAPGQLESLKEPLLARQEPILVEEKGLSRALDERILNAVQEGRREEVLAIYASERHELLLTAYQNLFDQLSKEEMNNFEAQWEDLDVEDDLMALSRQRPELKMVFMKMMAYRVQKNLLG
eukprot:TRINITY_DN111382_c0_g1_i1.p1 TRINITY_DN111382_c0_g1~~TRINITY_DN111382_c0_g1_i1.p1  ORF type:complete len:710 (-),score=134.03 TRINITY_DN111382_c0_g1_i1:44-2173(-)